MMKLKTFEEDGSTLACHENISQKSHQKKFPLLGHIGHCQYQNSVCFEKILVDNKQCNRIKIINQLCTEKGDVLEKVTSIKFGDQVITIRDLYQFDQIGTKISDINTKKRIQIFKKPIIAFNSEGEAKSRLTKNLPKNFIKAFMNYLQDVKSQSNRQLVDCKIQLLSSRQKYNNSFIQKILDDQQLQPYFRDFLVNHAQNWINNSKIRNKKIHLQAINIFLNLKDNAGNNNGLKPDSTNSYSSEGFNQNINKDERFGNSHSNNEQGSNFSQLNESQRDSILANQSKNYCLDQR